MTRHLLHIGVGVRVLSEISDLREKVKMSKKCPYARGQFRLRCGDESFEMQQTVGQTEEWESRWMAKWKLKSGVRSCGKVAVSQDLWHDPSSADG